MAIPPGWYDAGVPGQVRWWDGARWTEHVASAPAPGSQPLEPVPGVPLPSAAPSTAPDSVPGDAVSAAMDVAMGWYPTTAGRLRWWDGSRWTGLRVKNGKPGTDWATSEQPVLIIILGSLLLGLAVVQLTLSLSAQPSAVLPGVPALILALLWLAVGAQTFAVRRIPPPFGSPTAPDVVLPLPGTVEGVGAGWEPLTPRVSRWWTGTRWTHYVATRYGVRPTFHGPRGYRRYVINTWVLVGVALASIVAGIVLPLIGAESGNPLLAILGVLLLLVGIGLSVVSGVLVILRGSQRRLLLLPKDAPQPTPGG